MPDLPWRADGVARRADVHAARCSDGIIVLDIANDAYLSLYAPRPASGAAADEAGSDILLLETSLTGAGFFSGSRAFRYSASAPEGSRWRELPGCPATRPPLRAVAAFLLAFAQTCLITRVFTFARLIAEAERRRSATPQESEEDLARLVGWFDRLSLWLPQRPLCLFRSLMLLLFLRRFGTQAQWVFGATLFPFQAHCWLAIGDLLVGERADRIEEFASMFVAGGEAA